jgi:hypothetical protein
MYYTDEQLRLLMTALASIQPAVRERFFQVNWLSTDSQLTLN